MSSITDIGSSLCFDFNHIFYKLLYRITIWIVRYSTTLCTDSFKLSWCSNYAKSQLSKIDSVVLLEYLSTLVLHVQLLFEIILYKRLILIICMIVQVRGHELSVDHKYRINIYVCTGVCTGVYTFHCLSSEIIIA